MTFGSVRPGPVDQAEDEPPDHEEDREGAWDEDVAGCHEDLHLWY